jgi:uncharacterized membrane protein YeaQ/YmgE (transglycosylase-associated protein family)
MALLWWVIVGLIAGWATGKIMRGHGYGPLLDIIVGIIGAIIGGWIVSALGIYAGGGLLWSILVAILGGIVFTAIVRLLTGNRAAV